MHNNTRAAIWMIGAIASFTSMAVAGRALSFALDTFEIMLFRSLMGIVIVCTLAYVTGAYKTIRINRMSLHFVRNITHFAGQNFWFYAITVLPLTQVFAFEFTAPIWAILLAPFLLGERITRIGALAALIGFVGVLIVTRPFSGGFAIGHVIAAAAALGFAFSAVFTRRLTRTESIVSILFWLTVMQAVFGLICAGYDGDITLPDAQTLPWLILIAFAGLVAHFCLTKALSIAPAAVVMPIDFARLPVIAIVAATVYSEPLEMIVFIGAIVIFGANYLNITKGQPK